MVVVLLDVRGRPVVQAFGELGMLDSGVGVGIGVSVEFVFVFDGPAALVLDSERGLVG